jgi:DNA-binding NtrC family response regulator
VPNGQAIPDTTDGSGNVVILCGEEEVRDVIAYWFTSLPTPTMVAADGHQANRILRERNCRLLITDRVLPPWPGLDTFRSLRDRNPRLRVAYVENGNIHDQIVAGLFGVTEYCPRPLTRKSVIQALLRVDAGP